MKAACDPASLAKFACGLFSPWLAKGAPGKESRALRALGWIGDDDVARKLTRLIRRRSGEPTHAREVTGLEALADIGSDVALMNLNAIAKARDLTAEELADRLAPDLALDDKGGLGLDFGPRRFLVGLDEMLTLWVRDEAGQRLKAPPKGRVANRGARQSGPIGNPVFTLR